ncbi:flagellar export protein FliJ [Dyella subtropica]|uniref:flagellar export protein FliJ n=1 Tax=Dyella subtropica TaxID=2992127 RepID=UPI002254B9BE|nr:flagellar export protein FliJ [Dyella subtropica]
MKSRASQLTPAVDQARQHCEDAVQRLAEQQRRFADAERQLAELRRYHAEYAIGAKNGGLSVTALLNQQHFAEKIDRAIGQQIHEVERQRRLLEQAGGAWRAAHAREKALDSVVDRYREQGQRSEERREQNDIDERMQNRRTPPRVSKA